MYRTLRPYIGCLRKNATLLNGITFDRIKKKISYFETKLVGFLKFFSILFIDTLLIMLINFYKHNKLTDFESSYVFTYRL